jgi:hypothetical protein
MEPATYSMHRARELAQSWLEALRAGQSGEAFARELAAMSAEELAAELNRDAAKLAFWINVYNAAAQSLLSPPPAGAGWMHRQLHALRQYRRKGLLISGHRLSLNDIEHGLLRRSRLWWSPNFGRKIWPSAFERRHRADRLDPRLHFALNCAAMSCPPIRSYRTGQLDAQLDLAASAYLEASVHWDSARQELHLPALLRMFRADFGGKKGVLRFLNRYRTFTDPENPPKIRYQSFDTAYKPRHFV